ncbi:CcdC protein domain-containing protein [Sphingomonas soli]|uniref:CcdC protein domain-containing protein n=1 Tax=Sphingomonas soli TaxID=266127 RepID=UPI00083434DF|nr:CcdC protein domain-containing protein [Sphingomonas soli]
MESESPGWLGYVIVAVILITVLAFRLRSMRRERTLKVERLWIAPALYLLIACFVFWHMPPAGIVWLWCAAAMAAGAGFGWWWGRMTRISVDPETHEVRQKGSMAAIVLIFVLIAARLGVRNAEALGVPGVHIDIAAMADILIAFALALLTAQRVEMFLRARRLLAEARGA